MVATRLDDALLAEYAERRFGYGSYDAPVWFVGMEEGGGGSLNEVRLRLETWAKLVSQPLDDLRDYHLALEFPKVICHFTEPISLQRTWAGLMRVLAGLRHETPTNGHLRQYQADQLGRHGAETCLLELLPLPSPGATVWHYDTWSGLPQLESRRAYEAYYAPRRVGALRQLIALHRPALVCFYGLTHATWWRQIAGVELREVALPPNKGGFVGQDGDIVYLLLQHPVAFGVTNSYFSSAGAHVSELVRQRIADDAGDEAHVAGAGPATDVATVQPWVVRQAAPSRGTARRAATDVARAGGRVATRVRAGVARLQKGIRMSLPMQGQHRPRPNEAGVGSQPDWHTFYSVAGDGMVDSFVARYPSLRPLLAHAPAAIDRYFGPHAGLRLEVFADPDAEGAEHLYLFVRTDAPFEEAYERQRRLDEEWWLDAMLEARGMMTVGIELA